MVLGDSGRIKATVEVPVTNQDIIIAGGDATVLRQILAVLIAPEMPGRQQRAAIQSVKVCHCDLLLICLAKDH